MDLVLIHEEIGDALGSVEGLRVLPFDARSVSPPAVLFGLPEEFDYAGTYGGGAQMIRFDLPVTVVVGAVSDRASRQEIMAYASFPGSKSVKAALESHSYTACDAVFVADAEFGSLTIGSVDYLAVTFTVQVFGA